jgi:hypothetical protein
MHDRMFCYKGASAKSKLPIAPVGDLKTLGQAYMKESFKDTCIPCQFCHSGQDAVGGKCPLTCIPRLGTRCEAHDHCESGSQFCSAITGHKVHINLHLRNPAYILPMCFFFCLAEPMCFLQLLSAR